MNLQAFLAEVNSHQKTDENPRIVNSEGSDCLVTEYHGESNLLVVYFVDSVAIPVEAKRDETVEMEFKGLDLPNETVELEEL